jgi:lipocalin
LQGSRLISKNLTRICKEAGFFSKTWHELARKPAFFKKHGMNLQGSRLISKNLTRIGKEAGLFQKTWHELARKPAYFKKPDTNWQGSQLPGKSAYLSGPLLPGGCQ